MKRLLIGGFVGLVGLVLGAVGLVAMQPSELHMVRTITIDAGESDAAPYLSDLALITTWSPWRDLDPDLVSSFSETTTGPGAWYRWSGNDDVGEGVQTIVSVAPNQTVQEIHFIRPFDDVANSTISWTGDDARVTVSWSFDQEAGMMTKAANLVLDIEGMLAKDYDRGLADLKPMVEAAAAARREEAVKQAAEAEAQAQAQAAAAEAGADAPL